MRTGEEHGKHETRMHDAASIARDRELTERRVRVALAGWRHEGLEGWRGGSGTCAIVVVVVVGEAVSFCSRPGEGKYADELSTPELSSWVEEGTLDEEAVAAWRRKRDKLYFLGRVTK
jgi:hypothetical protein